MSRPTQGSRRPTKKGLRAPSQRMLRAGELVRHALVEILREEDLQDPALAGVSVTVTERPASAGSCRSSSRRISTSAWRISSPARS